MISDEIQLIDSPKIPGLRFRHFRGGDDFKYMATITRVSAEVDDTERVDTPEEDEPGSRPGADVYRSRAEQAL
jgi:hypothetical protein